MFICKKTGGEYLFYDCSIKNSVIIKKLRHLKISDRYDTKKLAARRARKFSRSIKLDYCYEQFTTLNKKLEILGKNHNWILKEIDFKSPFSEELLNNEFNRSVYSYRLLKGTLLTEELILIPGQPPQKNPLLKIYDNRIKNILNTRITYEKVSVLTQIT